MKLVFSADFAIYAEICTFPLFCVRCVQKLHRGIKKS